MEYLDSRHASHVFILMPICAGDQETRSFLVGNTLTNKENCCGKRIWGGCVGCDGLVEKKESSALLRVASLLL